MSEIRELSADELVNAIEAVVDEFGHDYVYAPADPELGSGEQCKYEDEFGGCIVGNVIKRLVPDFDFELFESVSADTLLRGRTYAEAFDHAEQPEPPLRLTAPERLANALRGAQTVQDEGGTWGVALNTFHNYLTLDAAGNPWQ